MKNILIKTGCLMLLSFSCILVLQAIATTPALAAIRGILVYDGGDTSSTTEAGWTDNHLLGQTFLNPTSLGYGKVTGIELRDFKLGNSVGNQGGIVQVDLYEGVPGVSIVEVSPGYSTTQISPNPAQLRARVEKVYIPGWQTTRWLANLCFVDTEGSESYAMRWLQIDNPTRPCPAAWGTGDSSIVGTSTDGSVRFWTVFPWGSAYSSSGGWMNDSYLEVPFPDNVITPGQTYYVAIQQYYLQSNDYLTEGKYNCLGPLTLDTPGSGEVCGQDKVLISLVTTNNRYPSGQAYYNTYYFPNDGKDAATLSIKAAQYPVASISGPSTGLVSQTLTFNVSAITDVNSRLTKGEINVARSDQAAASTWGCVNSDGAPSGAYGIWCLANSTTLSNSSQSFSGTWIPNPTQTGTFWVATNIYDNENLRCTGNPWSVSYPWFNCGNADAIQVTIGSPAPSPTPTTPPALSTLNVRENNFDSPLGVQAGTYTRSGLRSTQSGSNYYNSLIITQYLDSNSNNSNVVLTGTAFAGTSALTGQNLYALTQSAYSNRGFVLLYVPPGQSSNQPYYNGSWPDPIQSFTAGGYFYVYYNGLWYGGFVPNNNAWQDIPSSTNPALSVKLPTAPNFPPGPAFQVRLLSPLGSRTWGNYGYLLDSSNNSNSPSRTPIYGP